MANKSNSHSQEQVLSSFCFVVDLMVSVFCRSNILNENRWGNVKKVSKGLSRDGLKKIWSKLEQ